MKQSDTEATQRTAILGVLVDYCGKPLTADLVDIITERLLDEVRNGPCSWAFKAPKNP